jgi:hypothetical protein
MSISSAGGESGGHPQMAFELQAPFDPVWTEGDAGD